MGKSIAIFNQKGGVGKTTTAINLGACLAEAGKRVLLLDVDPQGNTTSGVGISKKDLEYTVYDVLLDPTLDPHLVIVGTSVEGLDVLPADVDLAGAEIEMVDIEGRDRRLVSVVDRVSDEYDYILVDCPPSLGLLTINSLAAVDEVLVPIQCEFYALEGVSQLVSTIELVRRSLNKSLSIEGVVLIMFDGRLNLSIQVVQEVKKYFGSKVYSTVIPRNIRLAEAPGFGMPITQYDRRSRGAEAYRALAKEFLEREEGNI